MRGIQHDTTDAQIEEMVRRCWEARKKGKKKSPVFLTEESYREFFLKIRAQSIMMEELRRESQRPSDFRYGVA